MANEALTLRITAQTDEFVKSLDDIKKRCSTITSEMKEIDKQLKTESVDKVAKLAEKLQLVERQADLAAKEAQEYGKRIADLKKTNAESAEEQEKVNKKINDLTEKMALAAQKSETFTAQASDLKNELSKTASSADKAENEIEDVAKATDDISESAEKGKESISLFGQSILTNLASEAIKKGISLSVELLKNLADAAWDAAKKIAQTAWEWAQAGADYIETQNKVDAVFQESSKIINDWASNAAHDLRTTKKNALESASSFGNILVNIGATREEAAKYSMELVNIAAAQADFNNLDTAEVLEKIQSALAGNYKGLQSLGIVIHETDVVEKALAMTHKSSKDELTDLEKEYAMIEIVMEKSRDAQTKYAENSGSLVSLTAELKARFGDLRDEVGSKLTPVFETLFQQIADYIASDEGQELIENIIEDVEKLANDLIEFMESGGFQEFLEDIKEKLPEIWESAKKLAEALGVVVDFILELAQPSQYDQLKELDEAIKSSKKEVHAFAESANVDMGTLRDVIKKFAEENNLKLSEVYGDWANYEPQISEYMRETSQSAEDMKENVSSATSNMSANVQENMAAASNAVQNGMSDIANADTGSVQRTTEEISDATTQMKNIVSSDMNDTASAFQSGIYQAANADTSSLTAKTEEVESLGSRIKRALANFIDNSGWFKNAPGAEYANWTPSYSSGGPARAGQMYRINDDHGRRIETFIPNVDGYILNGNDTQRVINNSTNNSRTYGDLIVNVNSYGSDAASIADEIGAAVNRKLRMAGSW